MKVAAIQMSMSPAYEENIAKVDKMVQEAAAKGAKLILLPELFERRYFCQIEDYARFDYAEDAESSKTLSHFSALAKKLNVVLPVSFFEKKNAAYFNSIAIFDTDGSLKGIYRKSHIPTGQCYEEKFYFSPGDTGFKVFQTSVGKIGIGICWDQWFPETARILALKGAEILLFPTAIGSEPVLQKDSKAHWQNAMIGHAAANVIPVVAANRVGREDDVDSTMTFFGSSFITNQYGEKLAELGREEEGIIYSEFDLQAIDDERRGWGVFRDRRIDLYSPLLTLDGVNKE